jgi:Zn-dependent protease
MQFRLGSIPVRVHGSFFVMAALLGATDLANPGRVIIWVVVVTISVLIHELGHALMGRAFGLAPAIDLHGMGGTTSWPLGKDVSYGKRILISLAGPGVGLLVASAIIAARAFGVRPPDGALAEAAVSDLLQVNGVWAVLNLLPMLPLDGGNVMAHVFNAVSRGKGEVAARVVSLVVAGSLGLLALVWLGPSGGWYPILLCGLFAAQNIRTLSLAKRLKKEEPLRRELETAVRELHTGNVRAAISSAEKIVQQAQSPDLRLEALRILAYALVAEGRWSQLMQLLDGGLARALADDDLARFESAARESGSGATGDAIAALRATRTQPAAAGDFHAG